MNLHFFQELKSNIFIFLQEKVWLINIYRALTYIFDKLAGKDNNERREAGRGSVLYQGEDRELLNRGITEIVLWSRRAQATGPSQNGRRRWCRDECDKGQSPVSMAPGRFCRNIVLTEGCRHSRWKRDGRRTRGGWVAWIGERGSLCFWRVTRDLSLSPSSSVTINQRRAFAKLHPRRPLPYISSIFHTWCDTPYHDDPTLSALVIIVSKVACPTILERIAFYKQFILSAPVIDRERFASG